MGDEPNFARSPLTWWQIHITLLWLIVLIFIDVAVIIFFRESVPLWISIPLLCIWCIATGFYLVLGTNSGQPMDISMLTRNKPYKLLGMGIDHGKGMDSAFIVLKDDMEHIYMVQYWRGDLKVDHHYFVNNDGELAEHVVSIEFIG